MDNEEESCRVFSVCRPDSRHQSEYYVAKFAASHNVDFTNCPGGARIERENNLKKFKSAYYIDNMPKSGAGSEYGREQREEARRKRFGIRTSNYNPNDQPFILKSGAGKQQIRLKGTKNGGVSKNMNYAAFTLCGKSKFVSLPVRDWYDFTPMPKYKALNSEEAEEEFSRRDKTYNHFAIMYNKKYKNKEDDDHEKEPKSKNNKRSNKQLLLTEFELMSGSEEDDSEKEEDKEEDKDSKKKKNKKRKKAKDEENDAIAEAVEENDDADEGQELDYLSMSSDDDEDMRDDNEVYNDVGLAEEEGLKKFGSDDEEEEGKKNDDDNDKGKSSDMDSDSDSDIETNSLFDFPSTIAIPSNKSSPLNDEVKTKLTVNKKRKTDSPGPTSKKLKLNDVSPVKAESSVEETVKKCLLRKPTTAKDLIKKLSSKPVISSMYSKKDLQTALFTAMKKLKPQSQQINGILHFSLISNFNKV